MATVMSDKDLHLKAAKAYKHTGTTNALDGSEDNDITGDAKVFWDELNMRHIIDEELKKVQREWDAGKLMWNFSTAMSFIKPHPKRGEMDEWKLGMDDGATPDPDGVPYLTNAGDEPAENEAAEHIRAMDTDDWVDSHWLEHCGSGAGGDRGSGQGDQSGGGGGEHRGSGDAPATGWTDDIDDQLCSHVAPQRHLQNI